MKISAWSVGRPITTLMASLAVVVLGLVSYRQLAVQLIPDITIPTVAVFASADKSTEENLENITKEVESILAEMPRLKGMVSYTGSSWVWLRADFEYGTDIQYVMVDLEERLAEFRNNLDDRRTFIDAFPFSTTEFVATFMELSVLGDGDLDALFETASDKVEQQLRSISGVAQVEMRGLTAKAATVDINPDLLAAYGLNYPSVLGKMRTAVADDTFLGSVETGVETFYVRMNDKVRTVEQLADIRVDDQGIVKLSDVALIEMGNVVNQWVNRQDGKNAIGIELQREAGENMIDLARKTRERIDEINETLPDGVELVIREDYADYIESAINNVKRLAGIGALFALMVPLFFFRSLRVALIVFVSVPISLVAVFNLFYAFGMSINIFSIIGLALGVGMLVDNSIVVVENAFRLHSLGHSPAEAAKLGGVEVGRGLFAATLTTVAVFVPMVFMEGEFKLFIKEPTLALIFPLILSLLVALTLVPVFTFMVLRTIAPTSISGGRTRLRSLYATVLKWSLRHRGQVVFLILLALTFTSLESCQRIRQSAQTQEANNETFRVYFQALPSSTLSEVNRAVMAIEDRLVEHPDIETFNVWFSSERGGIWARLKEVDEREEERSWAEIRGTIVDFIGPIPGVEISLRRRDRPIDDAPMNLGNREELELQGLDATVVNAYAERLMDAMRNHPQITLVQFEEDRSDPLYLASVDREKTRLFDINSEMIGNYVSSSRSSGTVSRIRIEDGEEQTDVSISLTGIDGGTVDELKSMPVFSMRGMTVPFGDLTTLGVSKSDARVRRSNRQSSVDIEYNYLPNTDVGELSDDIKKIAAQLPNPAGIVMEMQGEARRLEDRESDFIFMILAGTLLIYVVMAAVFESFWIPFIIVLTNPLMLIGIVWGLDLADLPLDDLAAFGIILLIGLAVNNGIVLMDRAVTLRREGHSRSRAVFSASLTRLRPIIMTYLTTVLGLAPMAFFGEEGDQWRPVAVVIIGGLTSATVLTLVVLPCFYMMGDDFVQWSRGPFLAFIGGIFTTIESFINRVTKATKAVLCFWRWKPLTWPRRGWNSGKALFWFLVRTPGRIIRFALWAVMATLRFIRSAFGDAFFVIGQVLPWKKRKKTPATATVPHAPAMLAEGDSPVELSNIQVIFSSNEGSIPIRRLWNRNASSKVHALKGVNLTMERGLFGLLGPNGAGKTTMLRCIAGLLEPTRGTVRVFGHAHRDQAEQLAPLVGYLPQNHGHYDWMTLEEYLEYFAMLTARTIRRARAVGSGGPLADRLDSLLSLDEPASRRQAILAAVAEVNLTDVLDRKLGTFSGGMKQRAGIARVLLQAPPIIIVDEPTAGLDPVERVKVRLLLSRLAEQRLVIFSTHIVDDLEHACHTIGVMDRGKLIWNGPPDELRQSWNGRIWEVLSTGESTESLREGLVARGSRILFQIAREHGEGFRVLSGTAPSENSRQVDPSLEDALLAVLGDKRVGA